MIAGTNVISVDDFINMNQKKILFDAKAEGFHQRLTSLPAIVSDNNLNVLSDVRRFSVAPLPQAANSKTTQ